MTHPRTKALLAAVLVGAGGCADADGGTSTTPGGAGESRVDVMGAGGALADMEELGALGYVDNAEGDDGEASGVVLFEASAAWAGVSLYTSLPDSAAFLIDMEGTVLHSWRDASGTDTRWSRVELLEDGDVLCVSPKENNLIRMRWDGTERWRIDLDAHHDVRWTGDRILVLTRSLRKIAEIHPTRYCVDNELTFLTPDGEVESAHSLYDVLRTAPEIPMEAPANIAIMPADVNVDPIHCNTVEPMRHEHLADRAPMYAPGNVLLTLRYPCAVAAVDPAGGRVLWSWGPGELEGPHDATILENGNVLLLDNGWEARGYSRVLEVDPMAREIVWEYTAPVRSDFFTAGRGTVQPLPNGNVLVGNSNSGEAFEVTRAGRMVWRFLNPNRDERGGRGVLRIRRFEAGRIEAVRQRAEQASGKKNARAPR